MGYRVINLSTKSPWPSRYSLNSIKRGYFGDYKGFSVYMRYSLNSMKEGIFRGLYRV